MGKMFSFAPGIYTDTFASTGYVHIAQGLTQEFFTSLIKYIDEFFGDNQMKDFAQGGKQQALYEFIEPGHYDELREAVATICRVDAKSLVLAERHIKAYEVDANPYPLAHKDRFGSEVSVGFSIHVPENSTLVLYPEHDVTANPFNSTAELRSSFRPHTAPESGLKRARRVEIHDKPRDVTLFRGSAMWHLRERGAATTVLYLKLNTYNCDTLGEDPHSLDIPHDTLDLLHASESTFVGSIPVIARKVDYVHRRYNRDWKETLGVVMSGGTHLTINETEFQVFQAMDGQRSVADITKQMEPTNKGVDVAEIIQRLAECGIIELRTYRAASGEITRRFIGPWGDVKNSVGEEKRGRFVSVG